MAGLSVEIENLVRGVLALLLRDGRAFCCETLLAQGRDQSIVLRIVIPAKISAFTHRVHLARVVSLDYRAVGRAAVR